MNDSERIARLEVRVDAMEKTNAKIEEIDRAQMSGFNEINLHLADLTSKITLDVMQRFDRSEKRWDWFLKIITGVLIAVAAGIIMLWIRGS